MNKTLTFSKKKGSEPIHVQPCLTCLTLILALVPVKLYLHKHDPTQRKDTTQFFKWAKDLNRHFSKKDKQMPKVTRKKSSSFVIRKLQTKTTMR